MAMPGRILYAALGCALAAALAGCDQLLPDRPQVVAAPPADSAPPAPRTPGRASKPASTSGVSEDEAFNQIRRALHRLVAVEQGFYAENGAYTEDFERLGYRAQGESRVRFLWLTREGWAASGTHPALPGRDCVIFVGRVNAAPTSLKYLRTAREGVPACDVPPPPPRRSDAPTPVASRATDTGSALEAVSPFVQMRVDLRNLAKSQEAYRAAQGVYSRRTEPLALQYLWQRGVTLAILHADAQSWSARASHVTQPGRSCVIWYGPVRTRPVTDAEQRSSERSGEPVCDE